MLFNDDDYLNRDCRGNVRIYTNNTATQSNHRTITYIEVEEKINPDDVKKCYMKQKINYHVSQLPMAAVCPPAPYLGCTKTLPGLK